MVSPYNNLFCSHLLYNFQHYDTKYFGRKYLYMFSICIILNVSFMITNIVLALALHRIPCIRSTVALQVTQGLEL